jgi:hypothetical protein
MFGRKEERIVPYKITFEPRNRIAGVTASTVEIGTAVEAWAELVGLEASDEKATIQDAYGREIGREELRAQATKEAH